jgi:UDP-N-acetylmuramate: L-alanyl-gamma-D-glutamyl-meso-diaminopimelate ligase
MDLDWAISILKDSKPLKRRRQVRLEGNGVVLIEDFAHHPTAVAQTIRAVREAYPGKAIWPVFEPSSNTSRRKIFEQDYLRAFKLADRAVIAQVAECEIDRDLELFDAEALSLALQRAGTPCAALPDARSIADYVFERIGFNDIIVVMSNGSFGGLIEILGQELAEEKSLVQHVPARG